MMVQEPLRTGIPYTHWSPRVERGREGGREGERGRQGGREGGEEGGRGDMTGVNIYELWFYSRMDICTCPLPWNEE